MPRLMPGFWLPPLNHPPLWQQPASASDVPYLFSIAKVAHPSSLESEDVFAERIELYPEGCLILTEDDQVFGYAISHPIRRGQPPAFDSSLGAIAPDADAYYIHDLAIIPELRGEGLAECVPKLLELAQRYESVCVIAVNETAEFWGRFGFVKVPVDELLAEKVRGYGDGATFLLLRKGE